MTARDAQTDDELAMAFSRGDAAAMETLYRRHSASVLGWLSAMLRDHAEAEDLSQEIWIKLIRGIGRYRGGNFKAWLWRIVRNAAIDHSRRRADMTILDAPAGNGADAPPVVDTIPDSDAVSAISRLDAKEAREAILAAIGELTPQLREVVLMRVNSDLKFREIADITGLPLGTVLGRMNQASKKLKESLIRKGIANDWNT